MRYGLTEADEWDLFDTVRRITVPGPHHGYQPPVIGWWDRLGYTHCNECPPVSLERDDRGYPDAISGDNCAVTGVRCDTCGVSLLAAALERWQYDRQHGYHVYRPPT